MSNSEKRFLSGLLDRIFSPKKTEHLFESKGKGRKSLEERRLSMEPLEERQLLAVTPADYAGIQTTFDSLDLNDYSSVNIIEIDNTSLTSSSLREAVSQAANSQQDDVILLRTTKDNYTIDLQGDAIQINIDSSTQGSISIIGYGESMLHLINEDLNVINVQSGEVNLGGLNLVTMGGSSQLRKVLLNQGENADVATQRVLFSSSYTIDTTEIIDDSLVLPSNAGTSDSDDNGYYSAEFQLSGSNWVYVSGLTQYEAQDIENNVYAGTVEFYVGEFFDAEKDGINDSQLCWAATASNILAYTNWGYTVGEDEYDIFDYFKENFTDGGSRAEFGIEWFMNGYYEAQGVPYELLGWSQYIGTGGNLYPEYAFDDYGGLLESDLYYSTTSQSPLFGVEQYLRNGYGIGIGLGWYQETEDDTTTPETSYSALTRGGGHAITMWGFIYDDTKVVGSTDYYVSVLVSDSDDDYGLGRNAPNRLQTYDITWRETEMQYEFVNYGRTDTYFGIIEDFQFLAQAPEEVKSDDPYEVNNSIADVNAFTEGAENSPNLGLIVGEYTIENLRMLDGIDWFKFELPQNASMYDHISISYNASRTNYLQLFLCDANGSEIRRYDEISSVEKISLGGLDAGSYFIKVVGDSNKPVRRYTLHIQTCSDDPYELNNTRQQVDAAPERTDANHEIVNPNSPNLGIIFEDRYTVGDLILKQNNSTNSGEIDGFRFEMTGTGGENSYILLEYLESYARDNDCDLDLYVYKLADDEFYDSHSSAYWGEVVGSSTESKIPKNLIESDSNDRTLVKVNGREYVSLEGWEAGVYYVKVVGFVEAENTWNYKMTINLRNADDDPGIGVSAKPDLHFATPVDENWGSVFVVSNLTVEDYYKQHLETTPFISPAKFYDNDDFYLNFVVKASANAVIDEQVNVAIYINGVRYDRYIDSGTIKPIMAEYLQPGNVFKVSNLSIASLIDANGISPIDADGNFVNLKKAPDDILSEDVPNYLNSIEVVIDPDNLIDEYDKNNNTVSTNILIFENSDDPYIPNGTLYELLDNDNEEYCPILGPVVAETINDLKIVRTFNVVDNEITAGSTEDWFSFELLKTGEDDSKVEIKFELKDLYNNIAEDNQNLLDGDLDLYVYRHNDRYPDSLELIGSSQTKNNVETVSLAKMPAGVYYIRVIGFNGQTNSYDMTIIGAQIAEPTPPTNLKVDSKVNDILGISWELNPEEYITSCDIQWVKVEGDNEIDWTKASQKTVGRDITSTKLTGLESGATYAFRVRGNNAIGTSDWTENINVVMDEFLNPSTYYGLIVALNDYYGTENDISYTVSDARGVYDALLTDPHWAENNITVLTNTHATKAAITSSLRDFAAKADENDVFFFYFAGSGFNSTVGGDSAAYLCSYINSIDWTDNLDNLISDAELVSYFNRIAATEKQVILEVDGITEYTYDYLTEQEVSYSIPFVYSPMVANLMGINDQISILTAASDYEDILGKPTSKLSYFGTYMTEAMTTFTLDGYTVDINNDGRLSMEELYAYVAPRVWKDSYDALIEDSETTPEIISVQTPTFDANETVTQKLDATSNLVLENDLQIIVGTEVVEIPAGTKVTYQRNDTFRVGSTTIELSPGISFLETLVDKTTNKSTTTRLTYQGNGIVLKYQPESIVMGGNWKEEPSLVVTTSIDVSDAYDGQISLREAIAYANEGETVTFDENLANQTLELLKTLTINKGISIDGKSDQIVISGSNQFQIFNISNTNETPVLLVGLTLINGYTSQAGGAIYNKGDLYLANMLFYNNGSSLSGNYQTANGGAIYNASGASLTVTNSTFSLNNANNNGGAIYNKGEMFLYNSILYGNQAATNADLADYGTSSIEYSLVGIDPKFKNVELYDFRLTEDSLVAIDKGYTLYARTPYYTLLTDLRGIDRFLYNSVDIGAFEYYDITGKMEMSTVVTTIYDVVDSTDGKTSLREAIANAGGTNITYVTLPDGTTLTTNSGLSLIVKNGVYNTFESGNFLVAENGSTVAIVEGSVLTLSDGQTKVTYTNGVFVNNETGTTIVIPDGTTVTFANITYTYSNKKYTEHSLRIGTKITLSDGTTAMVEDGINVLKNIILSKTVTFDANALQAEMAEAGFSGNITLEAKDEFLVLREVTIDASRILNLTIDGNASNRIFNIDSLSSKVTLNNLILTNAKAESGAALYVQSGVVVLNSVTINNSQATANGGAIFVSENSTVSLSKSSLFDNEAVYGGAVYNEGTLTISSESSLKNNSATNGGAVYNAASATISGQVVLESNKASNGAAVYNDVEGTLKLDSVYIQANSASRGAGLYNTGNAIVVNVVMQANDAVDGGAGIYTNSNLTVINSTLAGNASSTQYGGGIYVDDFAKTYDPNTVVVEITNSILAFNSPDSSVTINDNFYSTHKTANLPRINYSLISNNIDESSAVITNSILNKDPKFTMYDASVLWSDWDLSLHEDSPAVKTGSLASYIDFNGVTVLVNKDIRGRSRAVTSNALDMGAYERSIETDSLIVTTYEDILDPNDGETSLREALYSAAKRDLEGYGPYDERIITFKPELNGQTIYWNTTYEINYDDTWFVKVSTEGLADGITISGENLQIGEDSATGLPTYTGLFKMLGGDVEFNGVRFIDSTGSGNYGGAFTLIDGTLHLTNTEMTGNTAEMGGAICQTGGTLYLINSLLHNNAATYYGGAIQTSGGNFFMRNTTIAANESQYYGGIDSYRTVVVIQNSIIAKNESKDKVEANFTAVQLEYSLVGIMYQGNTYNGKNGCYVGTPVSPVDPEFVVSDSDELKLPEHFQLKNTSLAVNRGNNNYAKDSHGILLKYDLAGSNRIVSIVDMGAFESDYSDIPSTVVTTLDDVVDKNDGVISLREAIENAKSLQTPITFSDDLVDQEITLELGTLTIDTNIKIDASNFVGGMTINGNSSSNIFHIVNGSLELISLQLTGGESQYGGAIFVESGSVSLTNVLVYGNLAAQNGGAVYMQAGSLNLLNTTIAGNSSTNGTGGIYSGCICSQIENSVTITLQNSIVSNNNNYNGFDIDYLDGYYFHTVPTDDPDKPLIFEMPYTSIDNPIASLVGAMNSTHAIENVNGNLVGTSESPIDAGFVTAPLYLNGVLSNIPDFNLNETSPAINAGSNYLVGQPGTRTELTTAGALFNNSEIIRVVAKDIDLNERIVSGTVDMGAYEFQNSPSVIEIPSVVVTTLEDLEMNILDGVISLREAIEYAGTVYIDDEGMTIKLGTTITFDPFLAGQTLTLDSELGAILLYKDLTIDASALAGGITIDANQLCRVIEVEADNKDIVLINLSITGGSATFGAGIYHQSGNLTIINSLISNNTAVNGYGAAIRSDGGSLKLVNCTVTKNEANYYYGGIYSRVGNITLQNTIIAHNTVGNDPAIDNFILNLSMASSFISRMSETQFLDFNGKNGNLAGTAQKPIDPHFVDWDANDFSLNRVDGDTGVISPAINTGDNGLAIYPNGKSLETDHDGDYRFIGGKVDMGAYESILGEMEIPSLIVTTAEDVVNDTDGLISLREAIAYASTYGLGKIITFSENLTDQTIYLYEALTIKKDVTIDGSYLGTGLTITTADYVYDRLFYIDTGTVNMRGMTLTNRIVDRQKAGESANDLAIENGGAIYVRAGYLTMYNMLVYDCMATQGAAIYVDDGEKVTLELVNVTIVNNRAVNSDGAAVYNNVGNLLIKNTIIAKNEAAQDVYKGTVIISNSNTFVSNSFIENSDTLSLYHSGNDLGESLTNFIGYTNPPTSYELDVSSVDLSGEADLLFVDVDNNNFSLSNDSLAVNVGNNLFVTRASDLFRPNLDEIDLITNRRTVGRYVDMGAYECQNALDFYVSDYYNMVTTANDIIDPTDGYVSLREAVAYVQRIYDIGIKNISVTFDRGTLSTNSVMKLDTLSILINRPITIDATDVNNFTVNGQRMNNIFRISLDSKYDTEKVVIKNMTLYNGYELSGGGAIYHESGNVDLLNLLIHTNEGTNGGGILSESGTLTLINCTVANNRASIYDGNGGYGGGIYVNKDSIVKLYNTLLSHNYGEKFNSDIYFDASYYVIENSFISNAGTEALQIAFEASGTANQVGWGDDHSLDPQFINISEGNFQTLRSSDVVGAGEEKYLYDVVYVEKETFIENDVVLYETVNEFGDYVFESLIVQNGDYNLFSAFLTDTNTQSKYAIENAIQQDETVTLQDGSTAKYLGNVTFIIVTPSSSSQYVKNSIITLNDGDWIRTFDGTTYDYSIQIMNTITLSQGESLLWIDKKDGVSKAVTVLDGLTVTIDSTEIRDQIIKVDLNGVPRIQNVSVVLAAQALILNNIGSSPNLAKVAKPQGTYDLINQGIYVMNDAIDDISLALERQDYVDSLTLPLMEDLLDKIAFDLSNMDEAEAVSDLIEYGRLVYEDIAIGDSIDDLEDFFTSIAADGQFNGHDYTIYNFYTPNHQLDWYNTREVAAWGLKWIGEFRKGTEQGTVSVFVDSYMAGLITQGEFAEDFKTYINSKNFQTITQVQNALQETVELREVLDYLSSVLYTVANYNRLYTFRYTTRADDSGYNYVLLEGVYREETLTTNVVVLTEVGESTYEELYLDFMAQIESDLEGGVDIGAYQRAGTMEDPSLIVTTLDDIVDPYDGLISLREAIQYVYYYGWDNISDGGIGYNGEDGYGVAAGIPVSGPYHVVDAMSQSSIYANTYLYPITFDASLAGGTIKLSDDYGSLELYTPRRGATRTFDYMIDASSILDDGGIIIDADGNTAFIIGRRNGMDFDGETERDYSTSPAWYETTLLDVRGVTVKNAQIAYQVNYFGLLYMRNCLVYDAISAVRVEDNDSDFGGVAHIYNTTIQKCSNSGGIIVGGAVYTYNTIVDYVYVQVKVNNPAYRQFNAYNTFITRAIGGLRWSLTDCIRSTIDDDYIFINYGENDYRLNRFSVAVNTGANDYLATYLPFHSDPEEDINGDDRVCGVAVDMGCYESPYIYEVPSTVVTTELDVVADDGLISLREAIYYAEQESTGQLVSNTVTFAPSMSGKTITLVQGALEIHQHYLRIHGGDSNVTIDGNSLDRIFNINILKTSVRANVPNVYIQDINLKKGYSKNNGGAIYIGSGNVYLEGVNITQSEASGWGGAIYAEDSELTLFKVKIGGNRAAYYGGVVNQYGTTLVGQSVIAENVGTIRNEDIFGKAVRNYYTTYGTYGYNIIGAAGNISIINGQDNCLVGTVANPIRPFVDAANGNLNLKPEYISVITPPTTTANYQNEVDQLFREMIEEEELLFDDDLLSGLFGELID
ncbi:MAG: caspase family protein [Planctomycetia bacterium]|nr:caspase family protein [Planctomycetia bacterium]